MKNILTTLLAATLLAGNTMAAPTPEEFEAWVANDNRNSPEAQAYLAELLAKNTWSNSEALAAIFLQTGVMLPNEGQNISVEWLEAILSPAVQSAIEAALPKSAYLSLFKKVYIDKTTEGWTDDEIVGKVTAWFNASIVLINNLGLPLNDPFVQRVVALLNESGAGAATMLWRDLFFRYRASLPINEQITLTQDALSGYINSGNGNPETTAKLTAELVALKMLAKP